MKHLNHETENKATPVGSTAFTFMSLLNGGIFKNKARFIACAFQIVTCLSTI